MMPICLSDSSVDCKSDTRFEWPLEESRCVRKPTFGQDIDNFLPVQAVRVSINLLSMFFATLNGSDDKLAIVLLNVDHCESGLAESLGHENGEGAVFLFARGEALLEVV